MLPVPTDSVFTDFTGWVKQRLRRRNSFQQLKGLRFTVNCDTRKIVQRVKYTRRMFTYDVGGVITIDIILFNF